MRYSVAITAALGLLFTTAQAQAFSGFVKEAGAGYAKLSYDTLTSKDLYLTNGERLSFGTEFTQMNLSLYGEVGVTSFLTVGINAPVARFNSFEMSDTAAGLGDIAIFAKAGLNLWGFATAIIVSPEFPTGRDEALVPDGFDGRINLPTGDGEFSTWFRLAVSRSLPGPSWMSSYVSAYGGYNARSKWADQIGAGGELGIGLFGWVLIQGKFDALFSPTPTEDLRPEGIFLFGEGTEYVAAGATISARIPATSLWLDFGFRNTFANLRNLYAGTTFSAGIAADW